MTRIGCSFWDCHLLNLLDSENKSHDTSSKRWECCRPTGVGVVRSRTEPWICVWKYRICWPIRTIKSFPSSARIRRRLAWLVPRSGELIITSSRAAHAAVARNVVNSWPDIPFNYRFEAFFSRNNIISPRATGSGFEGTLIRRILVRRILLHRLRNTPHTKDVRLRCDSRGEVSDQNFLIPIRSACGIRNARNFTYLT